MPSAMQLVAYGSMFLDYIRHERVPPLHAGDVVKVESHPEKGQSQNRGLVACGSSEGISGCFRK